MSISLALIAPRPEVTAFGTSFEDVNRRCESLQVPTVDAYIVNWQYDEMGIELEAGLKALANDRRLQILDWLKDPTAHFRPQVDGDLVKDGVCGLLIAEKLGVSQPTASEHLRVLTDAGFLTGKRVKQWIFYQRAENEIVAFKALLKKQL